MTHAPAHEEASNTTQLREAGIEGLLVAVQTGLEAVILEVCFWASDWDLLTIPYDASTTWRWSLPLLAHLCLQERRNDA